MFLISYFYVESVTNMKIALRMVMVRGRYRFQVSLLLNKCEKKSPHLTLNTGSTFYFACQLKVQKSVGYFKWNSKKTIQKIESDMVFNFHLNDFISRILWQHHWALVEKLIVVNLELELVYLSSHVHSKDAQKEATQQLNYICRQFPLW